VVVQQDKPIQINEWVFSYSESRVIKAHKDQLIDESLETVELNELNSDVLWHMISSYPVVLSVDDLLNSINDDKVNRNKLYQAIAKLRRIFDDKTHAASYIETVPKQGYKWLVEPINRHSIETENTEELNESVSNFDETIESNEADSNSALETGIFNDLGFIEQSLQSENSEDISIVENMNVESIQHATSTAIWWKNPWLWTATLLMTITVIVIFSLLPKEPLMFIASDKLYVSPLTISENSEDISPKTLSKMQWWVNQKLQHLPAITVLPSVESKLTPHVNGVIEREKDSIKLILTITPKQRDAEPQEVVIVLDREKNNQAILNNKFNHFITELITGTPATTISHDVCTIDSFISSGKDTSGECLAVIHEQYLTLETTLLDDSISKDDQELAINSLEKLARDTIDKYSGHSIGYQILASYYHVSGMFEKAHEQLLVAMEINQNEPLIIKKLSESYRRFKKFNRSILLVEALLEREEDKNYALYWKAYDLVALGYLNKAQKIIGENDIELSTLRQKVYFFGINYNQLKSVLNHPETLTTETLDFIDEIIDNDAYCFVAKDIEDCIQEAENNIHTDFHVSHWKAASLYLTTKDADEAYKLVRNDPWLDEVKGNLASGEDRLFFVATFANILIQIGKEKEAEELLNRFIVFVNSSNSHHLYALTLAEAYALLGQRQNALEQMAKLLAQGWLPNAKYQMWPLKDNPNFHSIKNQWQFLNLLELIENRGTLIKLSVGDIRKSQ